MAGLDPATQRAHVSARKRPFSLADARWLGGRLKGGHGDWDYSAAPGAASPINPAYHRSQPRLAQPRKRSR